MSPVRTRFIRVLVLCVLAAALAPLPGLSARAAAPTVPCWVTLLNDWYDGVINHTYPLPCYAQALQHIPAVATIYGSAREDIVAAEHAARLGKPPPGESSTLPPTTSSNKAHGITRFLDRLVPGNPNSFPTPLLVLGLLAILLVVAGAAGMLWQRSHPRDDDVPPAS